MNEQRSPGFVVRIFEGTDLPAATFRGSGVLITPDIVLSCRHVVIEKTPAGSFQ